MPNCRGSTCSNCSPSCSPARFMVPTPQGLARALGLAPPASDDEVAAVPARRRRRRCSTMPSGDWPEREGAWTRGADRCSGCAGRGRRLVVAARCAKPEQAERWLFSQAARMGAKPRRARARAPSRSTTRTSRERLATADRRAAPSSARASAPLPPPPRARSRRATMRDAPNMVLAEAGTGIGKTLGYLAPASLWAEQAGGAVWVSTFTKALQRQLGHETRAAVSRPGRAPQAQVVTRKGRENYLCLLNLEDALQGGFAGRAAILAQLVARWAAYQRRRRHGRRRPARLAADAVPPQRIDRADRPARRVRLCRLPALPEMLHRARRARSAPRPISSSPTMRW